MAKARSRVVDFGFYCLTQIAHGILMLLPHAFSIGIVRGLAYVAYLCDRRHRQVAIDNLRHAFPGRYTEAELHRLTLEVYRHFGMMLLELLLLPRKWASLDWRRELVAAMGPEFRDAIASRRPLLIVTAHFGSWEAAAFILRAYGIRSHLVARPLDNPYVDDAIRRFRESTGHTVLSKQGDLRRMMSVLKRGGALCTLADQYAGRRGMFVDFFGRPASTHQAIAVLGQRTDALMIVVGAENTGGLMQYAVRVTDVIDPREYSQNPDAAREITQRLTFGVERMVRLDPTQYMWLHARWKHSPTASAESSSIAA